ncbi:MAG: hypothetical protein FWF15_04510 [Oscillospiraceae bacterium]|nr:hypothetical protein [Oscillospiraceae bacterium]
MNGRERAAAVFKYRQTDIPCFDLMEGTVWDSVGYYFRKAHGLRNAEDVIDFLDCDFRWSHLFGKTLPLPDSDDAVRGLSGTNYSDSSGGYLLSDTVSVADIDRLFNPDPYKREIPDFEKMRRKFPDKALVFCVPWTPFFSGACSFFGMERAMITMLTEPELYYAFAIKQKEYLCEYIRLAIRAGAAEYCDFFWTGDDFASENGLILSPAHWRKLVKPYLKEAFDIAKTAGMLTLFHSCGAVSEVYPDFIEMGIDSHIGVQTSGKGMDIERLARDFGGKLVIFGGIDAQTTLIKCTSAQVERETRRNIGAFADCGGYIVSNSHHGLPDIPGENLAAMARAAGRRI